MAADPAEGELGIAVQSKFLSVGAVVPWLAGGVGAIATQAWANTSYGPLALELMRGSEPPDRVARALLATDEGAEDRQFGLVDASGRTATFTGSRCITWAGGDKRGQQSAALMVVKPNRGYAGFNDRYVDLRVDDHLAPIDELARLLELHKLYFFPAAPEDIVPIDDVLGREIVAELARVGAHQSRGTFDDDARTALVSFMHVENLENRVRDDGAIDRQTLDYLRNHGR